jgi:DNA-directed RNA polymerase specialized sigma24 family protein
MLLSNTDDIIAGLKIQDPAAIEVVFSAYRGYAKHHYLRNYCRQFGTLHLDDVKQQCLISLFLKGPQFRGSNKPQLDAFTKKMFRNNIDHYMRRFVRNSKKTYNLVETDEFFPLKSIADPAVPCIASKTVENVVFNNLVQTHIIPSLNDKELELFNALMEDKDLSQIRKSINVSSVAIRQRKCRLKHKVKALINTPEAIKTYKA